MRKFIIVIALSIWIFSLAYASFDTACWSDSHTVERGIPIPLADRPGNVYLESETVWVKVPAETPKEARSWRVLDDKGRMVRSGVFPEDSDVPPARIRLEQLSVGWYRVEFLDQQTIDPAAVVAGVAAGILGIDPL